MEKLLTLAKQKESEIEIFKTVSYLTSIDILNGHIESMDNSYEGGISFRVIKNNKMGFAYTTNFDEDDLETILEEAISNAENSHEDKNQTISLLPKEFKNIKTYNREIEELATQDKITLALKTEEFAYKQDKRIKKTEKTSYIETQTKTTIINSNGINSSYNANYYGLMCDIIAEENGMQESGSYFKIIKDIDKNLSEEVGTNAAKKACELLNAKTISPQKIPLVFDPKVGAQLLEAISHLFSADEAQKGKSLLAKKMNQNIGSSILHIIDDGKMKNGLSSSPFDDEGTPTQETILVESGKLIQFLHNNYTAKKEGKQSTGNGKRASYKFLPDVAPTNIFIKEGEIGPQEIISKIKNGLFVTRVMGMHTINPISGDFSIGAAGIMIENGEKTFPVRGITIAGNLLELLNSIETIGDDLEFFPSSSNLGSPTLLINNIAISG
ncbi:hypothetical protein A2526_02700 [candidate division WOR-1 bacterium RIFOXYD2_FULL_36_8]|uniref:Peptidase n=1 Tax=candidate division WOR-1 bacterium RIFOXYB2_FULL_36_35 TaxID=1802578 RepID=A0A1F4S5Q8_UNCSA|nr:MAG: hypothetical protein A2230_05050 [candidate division WOR-1 bacterium RIFOXYA2_FULL_36_21]OGC15771.1 MAG: hypothetical protein A2290_05475 [candidate division WOR-1 bacterium RIFOXYB2_FULL_36_35]OGC18968.1 MAG: hypothetical protein A2282_09245 [candidate division WOR-1 bacterium RIFOXYA12_FULL_36_13]OGC37483.1 MAG: hypothetical protein A2526_02700 [candidate division WOR-1 bacterium RIFOXYD2_FULL_36_8]